MENQKPNEALNEEPNEALNEEPNEKPNEESSREGNAVNEGAGEGIPKETKEEGKEPKVRSADQSASEEPTDKEIKEWIKENPFECDIKGCNKGKASRPYRHDTAGGINLHKYNAHGGKSKEDKEKKKAEPEGEVDSMDEIIRKTQAADLRGKLIRTMKRIKKLPKDSQEIMAGEYEMVSKWKDLTTKKEFDEEKQDYISAQLSSVVLPILEESEEEHKADEKKAKAKKEIKKEEEDDDDEDLLGYGDMKSELKMMKMRSAIDEAKADRAEARRRMDEEHQARMQALKSGGGGGFIGDGSSNNPMGLVYERIITFKHDEDGNVVVGENGQPIPESMRQIPVNPNAIVQSRGRGGDGGEASTIKLLETAVKLVKGDDDKKDDVLKELKEERKVFMDKISQLTNESRDKEIYSNMNKLAGAVGEINKKLEDDTDSFDSYLEMQEKLKEKNIYPDGGNSPEVRRIDLEIEKEKSRRSMDLMMMGKTFKMAETAIKQVTDGPIAKSMAKKIDQSDVIAEEEELPEDEELEADIEEEVAPQQEQPPVEKKSTRKIRGKTKKKRE